MTLRVVEHPAATEELTDAAEYYHLCADGLGEQFQAVVDNAIRDVLWNPAAWPPFPGWSRQPVVRSRKVDVFPYRVVYFVRGDELVIVAYAHQRRRPGYWRDRIPSRR